MLTCGFSLSAQQTFNINVGGAHVSDTCWVYDDGGPSGVYGSHVEYSIIISTTHPSLLYNIVVSYDMEQPTQSNVRIYDNGSGQILFSNNNASGTTDTIKSCANSVRITFNTDSDNPQGTGFAILLKVCDTCIYHDTLTLRSNILSNENDDSAYVAWDAIPGLDDYILIYTNKKGSCAGRQNDPDSLTTVVDTIVQYLINDTIILHGVDSVTFPGKYLGLNGDSIYLPLLHCDSICVTVYPTCDTVPWLCNYLGRGGHQPATTNWVQCSKPLPEGLILYWDTIETSPDYDPTALIIRWDEQSDTTIWYLHLSGQGFNMDRINSPYGPYFEVDTVFTFDTNFVRLNRY